jgi:hypothetical protein
MEPLLSGDSITYREKSVTNAAYRCDGCGNVWAIRWHAERCEERKHVRSFCQRYPYKVPSGNAAGYVVEYNVYERVRLGRDKRIPALV